ncbi:MAG: efflux RND transporter periplasmic adaptor subunit, partial [Pseudomonadota bacterium]
TAGELLFRIEPADFELAVEQAQANIDSAASDLALLEAEAAVAIQEWEELFPGQPITDLAAREPQIAAARSRLASAEAAKKTAALALSRTRISAPSDARVLNTQLNIGQVVGPNVTVGSIYALDSVEISAPLTTRQLETLQPVIERAAIIRPREQTDVAINGTVRRQNATLDTRTRLASIFIAPEASEVLTIGDFADVTLRADPVEEAMSLPATSFFGRDEVWIVVDGKLQRRKLVRLGERGDEAIVRGFDFGDGVVTLPPVEGYEGMKVSARSSVEERQLAGGRNAG